MGDILGDVVEVKDYVCVSCAAKFTVPADAGKDIGDCFWCGAETRPA